MEKVPRLPGIRFHPTDVELVMYYLKRKVMGIQFPFEVISEIDLYKFEPWDLPEMSCLKSRDLVWFFFCSPDKKYATGSRKKRVTDIGFWKVTGNDTPIFYDSRIVGMKRSLVFHRGKAGRGDRTDWVMHEYRLEDKMLSDASISQDAFVLCKIFEKSGRGSKNGEQYGAPFKEEDWNDDDDGEGNNSLMPIPCAGTISPSPRPEDEQNEEMILSALKSGNGHNSTARPLPQQSMTPVVTEQHPSCVEHDDIREMFLNVTDEDGDTLTSNRVSVDEKVDSSVPNKSILQDAEDHEIFMGLEDITGNVVLNSNELDCPNENMQYQRLSRFSEGLYLEDLQDPMEVGGAYLEFKDLCHPMEPNFPGHGRSHCLSVHYGTPVLPDLGARDSLGGSWEGQEPTYGSASFSTLSAEVGGIYAPQSLARGGFIDPHRHCYVENPQFLTP
ncbi:hypothetical protein AAC387_Pa04g2607 [Persea americana]